jgi:hypothetical protein
LKTAKDIEDADEQIIDGDFKTNPLISPTRFHRRTVDSAAMPGLVSLSLLDDNDESDTNTEHVVSKEEEHEDASFCELDDDDDDEVSLAESHQEPEAWDDYAAIKAMAIEDGCSEGSEETNVTEAESCESDEETETRVSLLPSFEEQTRVLSRRGRKPVCPVSPIKLKDRLRSFQQELTLTAL